MGNLFGIRRRAPQVTDQDRAILQLKQQRDKIKIYQKRIETDLAKNKDLALQLFQSGYKDRALIVLRRKKCMDEVLTRTDKQLETLEQLVSDIEYTQIEVSVVEGLKVGTEALKQLNSLMNIDDIQQMMLDNEEAAAKQKEISEILQRSSERFDEDDLLKELETYKEPEKTKPKVEEIQNEPEISEIEPEPEISSPIKETAKNTEPIEVVSKIDDIIEELPKVPEELQQTRKKTKQREMQLAE